MVHVSSVFAASLFAASVSGAALPLLKRIDQIISDSTQPWVQACEAAGGADKCNPISVTAFTTLLAAAGPCAQQDSADDMIDLAKQLNNDANMISLAQLWVQQPRNAPDSLSVPYCQKAPRNAELNGLFHCQFAGCNPTKFSGDQTGNAPLGMTSLNPLGSCPAHPDGPIPDGVQLHTLTRDPGVGNAGSSNSTTPPPATSTTDAPAPTATDSPSDGQTVTVVAGDTCIKIANATGVDVGDLMAANPDINSGCTNLQPGQVLTLPQSNSTPDETSGDSGAGADDTTGDGSGDASTSTDTSSSTASAPATATPPPGAKPFTLQNGLDAQALNAKFATLTTSSSCTDGDQACVNGGFAQCVGGTFAITGCTAPTECFALPLVNKAGTTITCATTDDATSRIAATGATGGITGTP